MSRYRVGRPNAAELSPGAHARLHQDAPEWTHIKGVLPKSVSRLLVEEVGAELHCYSVRRESATSHIPVAEAVHDLHHHTFLKSCHHRPYVVRQILRSLHPEHIRNAEHCLSNTP